MKNSEVERATPSQVRSLADSNDVFWSAVVFALRSPAFQYTVLRPQLDIVPYSIAWCGFEAYALINTRELLGKAFVENLSRAMDDVAHLIPTFIRGQNNEYVEVDQAGFRFRFDIVKYWRDSPFEPPPKDRDWLSKVVNFGRTVEVKIGFAV